MFDSFLKSIFGSRNERLLKQYQKRVLAINALEPTFEALSDEALKAKTQEFKDRHAKGETLDQLLHEAFAVVREAGKRALGMRHFDVQLVGGMVLNDGKIAEMRTGEGKTLMATLPCYLNAISGKGVHVVTVNDYLAKRDSEWMGKLHNFLGLSVGCNLSQMQEDDKRVAFSADITYGTNNEFGFDYLRDNMKTTKDDRVMRGLNFAIVDEVDSILIDEARTPLIISGQAEDSTAMYQRINLLIPHLTKQETEDGPGDYWVDLKQHSVTLSEQGHERAEELLAQNGLLPLGASLYDPANIMLMHHVYAAVRAHALYHRDQHYVVQNNEVVIVDEFTGRMMTGRRWSEGLHQAVEAKEGVQIQNESQTLASITFQNYFRLYAKLAGMTGTADTEAFEFSQIYSLETVIVPPNRPMVRKDENDLVYMSVGEKYNAIAQDVKDCYERGQPVLLGTTSIENSELLSELLKREKIPHEVLNAKQHAREAEIVAQAGKPKAVTIATNMAGRGTDIVLGGSIERELHEIESNQKLSASQKEAKIAEAKAAWQERHDLVVKLGGLHIIGSERHESRRIDNQLRGRAGRQGDPGSSRFYLSFEDPLLKIFAGDRLKAIMGRLQIPEGEAIEHGMVSRSIENAQRKVEARNFDIRKQLLEYDDVANDQRKVIYQQRNELLDADDISETITAMRNDVLTQTIHTHIPPETLEEQWDVPAATAALKNDFGIDAPLAQWLASDEEIDTETVVQRVLTNATDEYNTKFANVDKALLHQYERSVMLQSLDNHWREHLASLDYLRQGIHLRGYAQKQPKQEYKREAFELFGNMLENVKRQTTQILVNVQVQSQEQVEAAERAAEEAAAKAVHNVQYHHADTEQALAEAAATADPSQKPFVRAGEKLGRNDPCYCGSGKKYKHCHGKLS
ncbi:MAG: preprotein translocase subunit SecA [Burkholderiales bacterium]|nr:preprotein translocase subunit SecA [Rhodocyclaceae bacterium]MCA3020492.1 preprotein translocase subunit SecA [Rhodocyclaceae bacterium]MCA3053365.1 preprotein translocase subunit SecA [Rhodocyclaceae bacterium]MCA3058122.1 preprotein translocase subunit SecA [Rhodocyclaceae bacterium]MCA3078401.1 preprotein translocase subunit SecA [Rhodocyclaceae bacterium]